MYIPNSKLLIEGVEGHDRREYGGNQAGCKC